MMKRYKKAFTLLELVFVIVILGIISKFGIEFLAQAYRSYIEQQENNKLNNSSSIALEYIAKALEYRIKDSVIIRDTSNSDWENNYKALEGEEDATNYDVLEWIGYDIDGFRGDENLKPLWSGIIDKEYAHSTPIPTDIYTPETNTTKLDSYIRVLSNGGSGVEDSAIYIMSSDSDVKVDYGWDANEITTQDKAMHPVKIDDTNISKFLSSNSEDFSNLNMQLEDVRYKFCWSAYAIEYDKGDNYDGVLTLYYDYQPWKGEKYTDGKSVILMEHVSTFRKRQSFNVMKIQICTKSTLLKKSSIDEEQYSICKEKTIY